MLAPPAVVCGDLPSPCEWADASQAIIPMARKAERARVCMCESVRGVVCAVVGTRWCSLGPVLAGTVGVF